MLAGRNDEGDEAVKGRARWCGVVRGGAEKNMIVKTSMIGRGDGLERTETVDRMCDVNGIVL